MVDNCSINVMKNLFKLNSVLMLFGLLLFVSCDNELPEANRPKTPFSAITNEGYELSYQVNLNDPTTLKLMGLVDTTTQGPNDLVIPNEVMCQGYKYIITEIADSAFQDCSGFTGALKLPVGLKVIGNFAFNQCHNFTGDLHLGDNVTTIGTGAFQWCENFTGVLSFGAAVDSIGDFPFNLCEGFTELCVSEKNEKYIVEDMMLFTKDMTTVVLCLPSKEGGLVIPETIETIGDYAFANCYKLIAPLTIPNGVTSIGACAFLASSALFGPLTIGSGVESIGSFAFAYAYSSPMTVTNRALVPQVIAEDMFYLVPIEEIPLYVPASSVDAYKAADVWSDFMSVSAIQE